MSGKNFLTSKMEQNPSSCSIGIWNYHLALSKSKSRIFPSPYPSPLWIAGFQKSFQQTLFSIKTNFLIWAWNVLSSMKLHDKLVNCMAFEIIYFIKSVVSVYLFHRFKTWIYSTFYLIWKLLRLTRYFRAILYYCSYKQVAMASWDDRELISLCSLNGILNHECESNAAPVAYFMIPKRT